MDAGKFSMATGCNLGKATAVFPAFIDAFERFDINTSKRQAAFLAQVAHESGSLTAVEESLRYSAPAILNNFGKYFTKEEADATAKLFDRERVIANRVYANRMGNGDEASGDGYRFKGRGYIQITGRSNYVDCGHGLGMDLLKTPELLTIAPANALSAAWFWWSRGLNAYADKEDFERITKIINGGLNGQADRIARWNKAKLALA